jgi:hypothetical protein
LRTRPFKKEGEKLSKVEVLRSTVADSIRTDEVPALDEL